MAVAPEYIDAITETLVALYRETETSLVRLITKHLQDFPDADPPGWAARKLTAVRGLRAAAEAITTELADNSSSTVRDILEKAYKSGSASAMQHVKPWAATRMTDAQREGLTVADEQLPGFAGIEALAAAVNKDFGAKSQNILRDTVDAYRAVIAAASVRTLSSANTRRQAAQAAWRRFVDKGITGFIDRAGRQWQLSSYVEMATRTVARRAAIQGEVDRLQATDIQLVYVSNAPQECQACEPFEGKVLALSGSSGAVTVEHALTGEPTTVHVKATLVEARFQGLFHPNCRHSISAFLPGVTKLPPPPTRDPKGRAARERQREIERYIRFWKHRQLAALDPLTKKAAGKKVRAWQAEMRQHLADNPALKRLSYREQIGAGNIPKDASDPAAEVWPPPPKPEPDPPDPDPVPPPPPPPEPGDADLERLLDVNNPLTDDELTAQLADGRGSDDERAEWAAALERFNALADAGEADTKKHQAFIKKLKTAKDPLKYARRRLGQVKTNQQRAATLRALWRELVRRAENRPPGMRQGRRWHDNSEAVSWAMKEVPKMMFPTAEFKALKDYTGPEYRFINDRLRGWADIQDHERDRFNNFVKNIDSAFNKANLPEALIVHRGVGRSGAKAINADITDAASMQAAVGKVFVEPGYISTSVGKKAAFSGDIYWMFRVPQGYGAMNAMHFSQYGTNEREFLIRRDARYVVHAVYQKGHSWYIEAEIVDDDWEPGPDWTPDPYGDAWKGYHS